MWSLATTFGHCMIWDQHCFGTWGHNPGGTVKSTHFLIWDLLSLKMKESESYRADIEDDDSPGLTSICRVLLRGNAELCSYLNLFF